MNHVRRVFLIIVAGIVLTFLLWWKLELGLTRYFDADEFAYLHWAHNIFIGKRPYYDFLSNVPTVFWYVLAPLYHVGNGIEILPVSRIFAFVVEAGMALSLIALGYYWSTVWSGIAASAIFLFLPIPSDKIMEVRPDNLAMLLALVGMVFHTRALQRGYAKTRCWLTAGLLYGLSLIVLPKVVPQVIVAIAVTLLWWLKNRRHGTRALRGFAIGLCVPPVGFVLLQFAMARNINEIEGMMYTLFRFPFEVNRIAERFVLQPDLFFYPNTLYYGSSGWNTGLIVNHGIWLAGLMVMVVRLFTPFIPRGRQGALVELLIAGTGVSSVVSFILVFTFRHAQYLIPSAVFVALFAAEGMAYLWQVSGKNTLARLGLSGFILVLMVYFLQVFLAVHTPKLALTNTEDRQILTRALATIPQDAYVFDLVGATIYFRDPYVVCCVPFGQWEPYLSRPLPGLAALLEQTKTRYIYQGRLDRITSLSQNDQAYIASHFAPLGSDATLLVRKE